MATMVCLVTPTFSASAACVISLALKRSTRMVLLMPSSALPMGSADPVIDEPRAGIGGPGQHQAEKQHIDAGGDVIAGGPHDQRGEATERSNEIGVAHRLGLD